MATEVSDIILSETSEELELRSESEIEAPKSLQEYVDGHTSPYYGYKKYADKSNHDGEEPTGACANLEEIEGLAQIDIDINKDLDEKTRIETYDEIFGPISTRFHQRGLDFIKTASGNIHIWCTYNSITNPLGFDKNDCIIRGKNFEAEIMTSVNPDKHRPVTLPGTKATNKFGEVGEYKFVLGSWDEPLTVTLQSVLELLHLEYFPPTPKEAYEYDEEQNEDFSLRVQELLIDGLKGFAVHNTTHPGTGLDKEVSIMPLFKTLNSLDESLREKAYLRAYRLSTESAMDNWDTRKSELEDQRESLTTLAFIIKTWNQKYYEETVKPVMKEEYIAKMNKEKEEQEKMTLHDVDFRDEFTIEDFLENAKAHKYRNLYDAASDLSRVLRYHVQGNEYYLEKTTNSLTDTMCFTSLFAEKAEKKLKKIDLFKANKNGKEQFYTALDAFKKHVTNFIISGTTFSRDLKRCIKVWRGWKYKPADVFNPEDELTKIYFKVVSEGLCGYSPKGTDMFIHKCLAKILQFPGYKTRVALVLQGIHRAGKGTCSDIWCELTAGFSLPNVNNIADIVGDFNKMIENKVLVVLNEQQDKNGKPTKIVGSLKSKITDTTTALGEKNEPKRIVENVMNLVIETNSARSIGIEASDPRYLVIEVSGKFKQSDLLRKLHNLPKEFYENLMAYYMNLDVSGFEPEEEKPSTDAESDLKLASLSYAEEFIRGYYKFFTDKEKAFTEDELEEQFQTSKFKDKMSWNTFLVDVRAKCQRDSQGGMTRTLRKKKRVRVYLLKEEYLDAYKPEENREEKPLTKKEIDTEIEALQKRIAELQALAEATD